MKTILLAAAFALPAVPALAQDSVHVPYVANELATAAGRKALERRVDGAVVQVCGYDRAPGALLPNRAVRACYKAASDNARPQIDRAIALAARSTEVPRPPLTASVPRVAGSARDRMGSPRSKQSGPGVTSRPASFLSADRLTWRPSPPRSSCPFSAWAPQG
jgi:UrcA family protein